MKKAVVAIGAVVAMVGIATAAIPLMEDYAATRLSDGLQRAGLEVETASVGLFSRSVTLGGIAGGPNRELKIESWKASGLAWPLRELMAGRLPLGGLSWGDPLSVKRLHLKNLRVAEPDEGGAWMIGELAATDLDLPRYDAAYDGPYRTDVMVARLLGALTVGRLEEKEAAYVSLDGSTYSVANLTVAGYRRGMVEALDVKDFRVTPAGARTSAFALGEVKAAGVDLRRPIEAASSVDWEPGRPIGRIPMAKARLSGFGGDLMMRYGLSLDSITTDTVRESAEVTRSHTRIDGFLLAPSLRSIEALALRMVMQAMGLSEVRLGFDCGGVDDRGRKEVRMIDCKLVGPELVEVSFTARLVEVDDEFWRAIDEADPVALIGTSTALASAKLVVADKSLLQRGLQAKAKLGGLTPSAERAALASEIRRYQPPGVLITSGLSKLLDAVARFVEQGGTLTIEAAPEPMLGLERLDYILKPGADLVSALGLTATVSR